MREVMREIDFHDLKIFLERYLKAGRISFSLLAWDNRANGQKGEMIINYDSDYGILYTKNDKNEIIPLRTETDIIFMEFIANFLEVNDVKIKPHAEPQLFFKLMRDTGGNTGFTQQVIEKHYRYIEDNLSSLTPLSSWTVNTDGKSENLTQFSSARTTYYDLGKVISGQVINNMEDTVRIIVSFMNNITKELTDMLNSVRVHYDQSLNQVRDQQARIDGNISVLTNLANGINSNITAMRNSINTISSNMDIRMHRRDFTTGGSNSSYFTPVLITLNENGLGNSLPDGAGMEAFGAGLYITGSWRIPGFALELGSGNLFSNNARYPSSGGSRFTVSFHPNSLSYLPFAGAKRVGAGAWVVMLRSTYEYTLWSKYATNGIVINPDTSTKYGWSYDHGDMGYTWNSFVYEFTRAPTSTGMVLSYSDIISGAQQLRSQNRFDISIEY